MSKDTIKILNFRNLDFDKLEYYQPNKTNYGSHIGNISYRLTKNNVMPVYIETPKLITTSGIIKVENKFYMEFEIDISNDDNPFYDFITKFDEKNIINCHFNSKSWFNKQIPYNVIEDYYKSPLKLQTSRKNPILKVRLPSYRGKVLTEIYNQRKELVDISKVQEGDEIVGIMGFSGLRFLSHQFIAEWELYKLKLLKDTTSFNMPSGYLFSDIESNENLNNKNTFLNKMDDEENMNNNDETNSDETSSEVNEMISQENSSLELIETASQEVKEESTQFTAEATQSIEEATQSIEEATQSPEESTQSPEETTQYTEEATQSKDETTQSTEETTQSTKDSPQKSTEETIQSTEEKIQATGKSTQSIEEPLQKSTGEVVQEVIQETQEDIKQEVKQEIKDNKEAKLNNRESEEKKVSNEEQKDEQEEDQEEDQEDQEDQEENLDDEFYDSEFELDDDLVEGVQILN